MAIREDVVNSAITFLQDPSVAAASVDKRIAFLQSKNLTQEEIDAALSRSDGQAGSAMMAQNQGYSQQPMMRQQSPQQYGFNQYPGNFWQPPPPVIPQRDWRDYFIMATVMSGLTLGVYTIAKRYVVPLIAPPTPPQLESDKAAIDASFKQAFDLIEQLANDTAAIKASEESRKERLDSALAEVEATITELKSASRRRDEDTKRVADEVHNLQGMIPKAMKSQQENTDTRLKELTSELKSLKTLVANRMTAPAPASTASPQRPNLSSTQSAASQITSNLPGGGNTAPAAPEANPTQSTEAAPSVASTEKPSSHRFNAGRAGIPAWQLAASKKAEQDNAAKKDAEGSSTATAPLDGAAA